MTDKHLLAGKLVDPKGRPYSRLTTRRVEDAKFRKRLERLFGEQDLSRRLQAAFERGHTSVDAWMMGKNIPVEVVMVVELLEACHPKDWPERWMAVISEQHLVEILHETGMPIQEIAKFAKMSPSKVSGILKGE